MRPVVAPAVVLTPPHAGRAVAYATGVDRSHCGYGAPTANPDKRFRTVSVGCGQQAASASPYRVVRQGPLQRHIASPSPCSKFGLALTHASCQRRRTSRAVSACGPPRRSVSHVAGGDQFQVQALQPTASIAHGAVPCRGCALRDLACAVWRRPVRWPGRPAHPGSLCGARVSQIPGVRNLGPTA